MTETTEEYNPVLPILEPDSPEDERADNLTRMIMSMHTITIALFDQLRAPNMDDMEDAKRYLELAQQNAVGIVIDPRAPRRSPIDLDLWLIVAGQGTGPPWRWKFCAAELFDAYCETNPWMAQLPQLFLKDGGP